MNEAIERDREFFARLASSHPGIVRTLDVLIGELDAADVEAADLRTLGRHIVRVGEKLIERADRIEIDDSSDC